MNILHVIHGFPPDSISGTEVYTYNLSKRLAKGHKVLIFRRIKDARRREYDLIYSKEDGLDIYAINNTFRNCDSFEQNYRNENISRVFARLLDDFQPDIVHIQHLLYLSTSIIEEIRKRGIPIVFTLHDYWLICQQGQLCKMDLKICENYTLSDCVKCLKYQLCAKKGVSQVCHFLRRRIPDPLFQLLKNMYLGYAKFSFLSEDEAIKKVKLRCEHIKQMCSMVDLFIAPSQFLRKRFIEFGIPEDKIRFITHGINIENFKDFRREESERTRFGFIGTILPTKGLHILINAFNCVKNKRAELKIFGRLSPYWGYEYYPRHIKKLVKNENIQFMGGFDQKEIAKIFSSIDVLVVPSVWYENFPLVIQEAFLAGVPVIASNIGAIPELVKNGETSLLFKVNDAENLYEKISLILDNPSLIADMRHNIEPPKSLDENVREIEGIYTELLTNVKNR